MSTTTISHQSFSFPLFTQLVSRLRHTSARYNQIACQCRHTYRPTYHAKRRAYRAGLRIDTSRARGACSWPGTDADVSASSTPLPSPISVSVSTENEEDDGSGMLGLRGLPEVVVRKKSACLSPLGLSLGFGADDEDGCDMPFQERAPGAPRLRPIPLPGDECGMEVKTVESMSYTYDPAGRGMRHDMSNSALVPFAGLGITVPQRHLKRKRRDVDVERLG